MYILLKMYTVSIYCGLGFADFPQGPVRRVAFLPNGKQIVTGGKIASTYNVYTHVYMYMYVSKLLRLLHKGRKFLSH